MERNGHSLFEGMAMTSRMAKRGLIRSEIKNQPQPLRPFALAAIATANENTTHRTTNISSHLREDLSRS